MHDGHHDDHDHGHDHRHGGGVYGHAHAPADFGRAFLLGIGLNVTFVVLEAVFGVISNSMALIADAGHNLSDVLGLVVAWIASVLEKRPPTTRYTYGFKSSSILAALFNAVFLLIAVGGIVWAAAGRFFDPPQVESLTVMAVAAAGIAINGFTAWLFAGGKGNDLNIRGAYMHMLADAAVSAGVVAAGLLILLTGWNWIDPLVSLFVAGLIVWGTWGLLIDSLNLALNAVPRGTDADGARSYLSGLPGVTGVHDLHIWSMSTTDVALTAHLVMPGGHPGDAFLVSVSQELGKRFGINHATVQIEIDAQTACALAPDHVI